MMSREVSKNFENISKNFEESFEKMKNEFWRNFLEKKCIKFLINLNSYEKFLSKISANSGLILLGV